MPESYRPKRGLTPLMLSQAVDNGSLVEARCSGCSPKRYYHPADLMRLFGDIPAMNLELVMKCERCASLMRVQVTTPSAEERMKITLRRLERVWWARRVRWREERL